MNYNKEILRCFSRLTPKAGDRLTLKQQLLLNEIAQVAGESIAYEISYILEPNFWLSLWLSDQFNGLLPEICNELAFPLEPIDPLDIALDLYNSEFH